MEDASGPATLEAFTIPFRPDGRPSFGFAVLRLPSGARTLARVPAEDENTLAVLTATDATPIGRRGTLRAGDGVLLWQAA